MSNLEKLGAVLKAVGPNANISWQNRSDGSVFFTVTYWPAGDTTRCAIGQGNTLPEACEAARKDAVALLASVTLADLEKVAA